ncbi:MAG: phosphoglycolate phosphatase [Gammaproteobacteria bacterium]
MAHTAVLFDLDGTLADTGPDLAAALNTMLSSDGHAPLPYETIRPWVSWGALRLIRLGYGEQLDAGRTAELRRRFLACYEVCVCRESRLFPGIDESLEALELAGVPWGIVTNKPGWLTEPLLAGLGLHERAGTVISGDTLPFAKPHPMPLLHAARELGVAAERCVYVGDNVRDVEAGRAAGMYTVAAAWGYIPPDDDPAEWLADHLMLAPDGLAPLARRLGVLPGVA